MDKLERALPLIGLWLNLAAIGMTDNLIMPLVHSAMAIYCLHRSLELTSGKA